MIARVAVLALAVVAVVTLAGCGATNEGEPLTVAATPTAAATPARASSPAATPAAAAPDASPDQRLDQLLAGETLARYRALPEEYKMALVVYQQVGVAPDLRARVAEEKMEAWGEHALPLAAMVGKEPAARLRESRRFPILGPYAHALGAYYVYLLSTEPDAARRAELMGVMIDWAAPETAPAPAPGGDAQKPEDAALPTDTRTTEYDVELRPEMFLPAAALERVEGLPPRLRSTLYEVVAHAGSVGGSADTWASIMTRVELFLLLPPPHSADDLPLLEDVLEGKERERLLALSEKARGEARRFFQRQAFTGRLAASVFPGFPATTDDALKELAQVALELSADAAP